jgi:hypothetical protein
MSAIRREARAIVVTSSPSTHWDRTISKVNRGMLLHPVRVLSYQRPMRENYPATQIERPTIITAGASGDTAMERALRMDDASRPSLLRFAFAPRQRSTQLASIGTLCYAALLGGALLLTVIWIALLIWGAISLLAFL